MILERTQRLADLTEQGHPVLGGSARRRWYLRLRRAALRQGSDDLDRFHADADDLSDEADDVLGVVGVVGVRADAGALVFLDAVLIDDPLDGAAVAEASFLIVISVRTSPSALAVQSACIFL